MIKLGDCSGDCGKKNVPIVNRKRMLCDQCNKLRLGSDVKGRDGIQRTLVRSIKPRGISDKGLKMIKADELFYEVVWKTKPHECEECELFLGYDFRDSNGKVADRFRYSHILGKGRYPMFRHRLENMNLLCLKHHQEWETGDQTKMRIYSKNKIVINRLYAELAEENKF